MDSNFEEIKKYLESGKHINEHKLMKMCGDDYTSASHIIDNVTNLSKYAEEYFEGIITVSNCMGA